MGGYKQKGEKGSKRELKKERVKRSEEWREPLVKKRGR